MSVYFFIFHISHSHSLARIRRIDPGLSFFSCFEGDYPDGRDRRRARASALSSVTKGNIPLHSGRTIPSTQLPARVRASFLSTVSTIVTTPADSVMSVLTRPGMEALLHSSPIVNEWQSFLFERQQAMRTAFGPSEIMKATPADCLSAITSKYAVDATLLDPVTGVKMALEGRFVNLSLLEKKEKGNMEADDTPPPAVRARKMNSVDAMQVTRTPVTLEESRTCSPAGKG